MPTDFEFSHTYQMPVEEYANLSRAFARFSKPWRIIAFMALSVVLLFSKWTFLLGCVGLIGYAVNLVAPSLIKTPSRGLYSQFRDMEGPIKYGVSEKGISFTGTNLQAFSSWSNLVQWRKLDGWLILQCGGMPLVFLPISEMEVAGILESVIEVARKNGFDYNDPTGA